MGLIVGSLPQLVVTRWFGTTEEAGQQLRLACPDMKKIGGLC